MAYIVQHRVARRAVLVLVQSLFASLLLWAQARPASAHGVQCDHWIHRTTTNTAPAFAGAPMAYDSEAGVFVRFGGFSGHGALGETWEFDGQRWQQRLPLVAPSAREAPGLTYDAARGVTVLVGGIDDAGDWLRDTWEWDGEQWTERAPFPTAITEVHLVYDSARSVTVAVANLGVQALVYSEWNGTCWTDWKLVPVGETFLFGIGLAYDAGRGRTVMFGGSHTGTRPAPPPGDEPGVWEYDGTSWTHIQPPSEPPLPVRHAMAYHPTRGTVVVFGGAGDPGAADDMWEWDGEHWSALSSLGLGRRSDAAIAYDPSTDTLVLAGGLDTSVRADTWRWRDGRWLRVLPDGPTPRSAAAMAYDSRRQATVLFGGWTANVASGETWEWNGTGWSLRSEDGPQPRAEHAMAYDSTRARTVLIGGLDDGGDYLGDHLWEWDGASWLLRDARPGHLFADVTAAYDTRRGVTVLAAGLGGAHSVIEEWDGTLFQDRGLAPGGEEDMRGHASAYDRARGQTVTYPGILNSAVTWLWDGTSSTLSSSTPSPALRTGHSMGYDSVRERVVLFGGDENGSSLGDTWEWDGAAFALRLSTGPAPRFEAAMAYDEARRELVLFGGLTGSGLQRALSAETWVLPSQGSAPHLVEPPHDLTLVSRGSGAFRVSVEQTPDPLSYVWRRNGVALTDGADFSGTHAAELTVLRASQRLEGAYDVVVDNGCAQTTSKGASLVVYCRSDLDRDHDLELFDQLRFIAAYLRDRLRHTTVADWNHDGVTTASDLSAFLVTFASERRNGC